MAVFLLTPIAVLGEADTSGLGAQGNSPSGASTTLNSVLQPGTTQSLQNGAATSSIDAFQGNSTQQLQGTLPTGSQLELVKGEADNSLEDPRSDTGRELRLLIVTSLLAVASVGGALYLRRDKGTFKLIDTEGILVKEKSEAAGLAELAEAPKVLETVNEEISKSAALQTKKSSNRRRRRGRKS